MISLPYPEPAADPPDTNTDALLRGALPLAVLTPDEVRILAGVFHDELTQAEIADHFGKSREWVSKRVKHAVRKLEAIGVYLTPPGKGRKADGMTTRTSRCDPAALDEMTIDAERFEGQHRGRWIPRPHKPTHDDDSTDHPRRRRR